MNHWEKNQRERVLTPDLNYTLQPNSARSTGSRTAKKIRKSHGLKCIIRDELKDDIDSLRSEVSAAVNQRRKTNEKLKMLVGLVEEIRVSKEH